MRLIYFSSKSGNTERFVDRLPFPSDRIPMSVKDPMPDIEEDYVLVCPTYADGEGNGAVPKQVIKFLNDPNRRSRISGVVGCGNRNFGQTFALSAKIISFKCQTPILHQIELAGTPRDALHVQNEMNRIGDLHA